MSGKCTAILLAAGRGSRMKSDAEKQFLDLCGKPLIWYSLDCFENNASIDEVILVTREERIDYCRKEIVERYGFTKVKKVIPGGKERYDSVYRGLLACGDDCEIVLVHDSARPFVDDDIIREGLMTAGSRGACAAGIPSPDTIKLVDEENLIRETPVRKNIRIIQTPQFFRFELLKKAYDLLQQTAHEDITDDAMVVERMLGIPVYVSAGSVLNRKVTTPEDLLFARMVLENREEKKPEKNQN